MSNKTFRIRFFDPSPAFNCTRVLVPGDSVETADDLMQQLPEGAQDVQVVDVSQLPPRPPVIPQTVTRFQALAALHLAGHLPAVQAIMAAPETPVIAKLAWDNALSFERTSPTLAALASQLGLNDAALDALFTAAASIEA